jgi:hypothetical protein
VLETMGIDVIGDINSIEIQEEKLDVSVLEGFYFELKNY